MSEDSAAVPASQPLPEAEPSVAAEAGALPLKPKHRRLRWLWWTAGSVFVASLAGFCAYLAVVAHQWSNRVDELTAISQDLGTQVADQSAARKTAEAKSSTLQAQLDTSNARITDLANEEANAVDHEAVWIDMLDSMISCADNRQQVIDAYVQGKYFAGISRAGYAAEITNYCDSIKTEYTNYKAEIGK